MNDIFRKLIGIVLAMVCVLVSLPGHAAATEKLYNFTMTTNGSQLTAVVTNSSPERGNAQFSSVDISVDLPWAISAVVSVVHFDSSTQVSTAGVGAVDLSVDGHLKISNLPPVKPNDYVTVTFDVTSNSCGEGTWSVVAYTGANFSGEIFDAVDPQPPLLPADVTPTTLVACGALVCNSEFTVQYPFSDNAVTGKRGFNSDTTAGTCGTAVNFYVTETLTPRIGGDGGRLHFRWDLGAAPTGAFRYTIESPSVNPKVAWLDVEGNSASNSSLDGEFIETNPDELLAPDSSSTEPNLFCIAPSTSPPASPDVFLPQRFGILAAPVLSSDTKIKVNVNVLPAISVPPVPFDFVIGAERLRVTKIVVATGTWTVTRGRGNTPVPPTHLTGADVMYTPMPLLPAIVVCSPASPCHYNEPTRTRVAKMCLTWPLTGTTRSFIDGGDGWIIPNE